MGSKASTLETLVILNLHFTNIRENIFEEDTYFKLKFINSNDKMIFCVLSLNNCINKFCTKFNFLRAHLFFGINKYIFTEDEKWDVCGFRQHP